MITVKIDRSTIRRNPNAGRVEIDRGSVYSNQLFLNIEGADHDAHCRAREK